MINLYIQLKSWQFKKKGSKTATNEIVTNLIPKNN